MFRTAVIAPARIGFAAAILLATALPLSAQQAQQPARPAQGQQPARPAQPAQPPAAAAPAAPQGEALNAVQSPWVKLCEQVPVDDKTPPTEKRLCMVIQETRAENGQMLASVQLRELEGEKPRLIIAVPIGMSLQPGIRVVLDQSQPQQMRYEVCMPNACFAQIEIQPDFIQRMRRATNLNIQVVNMGGRAISLAMSLAGFATSYDGAAVDPRQYEENQRRLAEELQRRAEEAQRRLQQQQSPAPGAPVPVPGAPAGVIPAPTPAPPARP